jgi:glycosyltransferase involved in cell wall biosynthesis
LTKLKRRVLLRSEDWARTHRLSVALGLGRTFGSYLTRRSQFVDAAAKLLASGLSRSHARSLVARAVAEVRESPPPAGPATIKLGRSIIAKAPVSPQERGVLLVSFETELGHLLALPHFARIEQQYQVVFLPTWQPAFSRELLVLAAVAKKPFVVLPSSTEDVKLLPQELGPLCATVDLQASSWIPAGQFEPRGTRDIDIILLANFSKYKRHWKLFEGLSQMSRECRVICAGRPWGGRSVADIRAEAEAFGVGHMVEVIENPSDSQVEDLLGRARMFCAMSHKEGSFVAVAEALVAGTPVGMFSDATIGTKRFINEDTGFFFSSREPLGPQLEAALARCSSLRPREKACEQFVAEVSMRQLNSDLRAQSVARGEPWTQDCAEVFSRNFAFGFTRAADAARFADVHRRLAEADGVTISLVPTRGT